MSDAPFARLAHALGVESLDVLGLSDEAMQQWAEYMSVEPIGIPMRPGGLASPKPEEPR